MTSPNIRNDFFLTFFGKNRMFFLTLPFLLTFLTGGTSSAATGNPSPVEEPIPSLKSVYRGFAKSFTLSDLGWKQGEVFSGTSMDRSAFFGISPSQLVENGSVTLRFTYLSGKNLPFYPRLEVDVNETPLGLLPSPITSPKISEQRPEQTVTFTIPPYLVTPLNSLRIRVAKDPAHPCNTIYVGPFIRVAENSSISLSGIRIHFPNRLSDLPLPFLHHAMTKARILPFIMGSRDIRILQAAGLVASWLGEKGENIPFRFRPSVGLPLDLRSLPTGNLVLLATDPQIPPSFLLPPITGPTLAIIDNPADPYGKILLLLGRTPDEIRTAALGLALGQFSSSGSFTEIKSLIYPPSRKPDDAPRWINTAKPVRFDQIVPKDSLSVSGTGSIPIGFSLPSDLFTWQQKSIPLHIHYRYATLPGEELSHLDLLLNKKYQDSIHLPPGPSEESGHQWSVPLNIGDLSPFKNLLHLNFNFRSSIPNILSCQASQNPKLHGTIFGDSTLDLRSIPHYVQLPNLQLFPNGGYPFTRYADLSHSAVILPDFPGEGDIRIFLHLMAFLAEETGTPGIGLSVTTPDGLTRVVSRNLIIIGTYDSNPLLLRYVKALPQDNGSSRSKTRFESGMEEFFRWSNPPPRRYGPEALSSYFREHRTPLGVMEEDVSPLSPHHVILSLGGVSENSMKSMDHILFDPRHFSDIFGQVSVVDSHRIHSFLVPGKSFSLGHLDPLTSVRFWFYSHPLGVLLTTLALILFVAAVLSQLLSTIASRRTGT